MTASDALRDLNLGLQPGVVVAVAAASSAKTSALTVGARYLVSCSAPTHIRLGPTGGAATVNDFLLHTGQILEVEPGPTTSFLHGISPSGGSGSLHAAPRRTT